MRQEEYWTFQFNVEAQDENRLVDYRQAEELLDKIIEWVEENSLQIGGGFRGP